MRLRSNSCRRSHCLKPHTRRGNHEYCLNERVEMLYATMWNGETLIVQPQTKTSSCNSRLGCTRRHSWLIRAFGVGGCCWHSSLTCCSCHPPVWHHFGTCRSWKTKTIISFTSVGAAASRGYTAQRNKLYVAMRRLSCVRNHDKKCPSVICNAFASLQHPPQLAAVCLRRRTLPRWPPITSSREN